MAQRSDATGSWFKTRRRRVLLDMHVPDWDPNFLVQHDPPRLAELYADARVNSAMFYCNSCTGLCNWPTESGAVHAAFRHRDIVRETVDALHSRDISACGYYTVTFNNWAALQHPEWRMRTRTFEDGHFPGPRWGLCCPNNPGYLEFVFMQIDELMAYELDGIFFDMTFAWPLCQCDHCRARYRSETGTELPEVVDWFSKEWCRYHAAREQWSKDYAQALTDRAKAGRPSISVHHNFISPRDWVLASPFDGTDANDFIGADFYGDAVQQAVISRLFKRLSKSGEVEFMTSVCTGLDDHVTLKDEALLEHASCSAIAADCSMLFIDAIDPAGTVNPGVYKRLTGPFTALEHHERDVGGQLIEDIGIYFSGASRMDFNDNGRKAADVPGLEISYPHWHAVRGACRALLEAHLPFGIVTKRDLARIGNFKVLILPNVLRMDREEIDAVREFVRHGGRLYASRYTSLTETIGVRLDDFMLADVFGCHLAADDLVGSPVRARQFPIRLPGLKWGGFDVTYIEPQVETLRQAIAPQKYITHAPTPEQLVGAVRVSEGEGAVVATLTLPFSDEWGTLEDREWSSMHSSPPWRDDVAPAVIRNAFGSGVCVYSAVDVEAVDSSASRRLFLSIIRDLASDRLSYSVEASAAISATMYHQPERSRFVLALLAAPADRRSETIEVAIPPLSQGPVTRASTIDAGEEGTLALTVRDDGWSVMSLRQTTTLQLVALSYGR